MTRPYKVKNKELPPNCVVTQPDPLPDGCSKIELSRGLFVFFDSDLLEEFSKYKWYLVPNHNTCYASRFGKTEEDKKKQYKMHREIMGLGFGDRRVVDHINGNGLDNRRSNLRVISHAQNIKAQPPRRQKPESIYIGVVYRVSEVKKWLARIHVNGKYQKIGYFNKEEDAARAYDREAKRIFGDNAELNFYPKADNT